MGCLPVKVIESVAKTCPTLCDMGFSRPEYKEVAEKGGYLNQCFLLTMSSQAY